MKYTKEQMEKLPKWAQAEIKRLEGDVKTLTRKVNEMSWERETNTYLVYGLSKMPLQKNAKIEFRTGKHNDNKLTVYTRSDDTIHIHADSSLGLDVAILPQAANAFHVAFIDREKHTKQ